VKKFENGFHKHQMRNVNLYTGSAQSYSHSIGLHVTALKKLTL